MARLRYNGLRTTLGASLTNSATSVTFAAALTHSNGTAVPTITGSDYIPLVILDTTSHESEIVYLTAYTSGATTGTIARGKEGTTGVAHSSGDAVICSSLVGDCGPGAWTAYTPSWGATSGTPAVGTGGSLTGAYQVIGNTVFFRINLVLGSTGMSVGTGTWNFGLPVAHVAAPSGIVQHGILLGGYYEDLGAAAYAPPGGRLVASSTTLFELTYSLDSASTTRAGGAGVLGATTPFSWGSGDYLSVYGQYQAA